MTPLPNIDFGFMDFARYVIIKATVILLGGILISGCISTEKSRCCYELLDNKGYIPCDENSTCELGLY